MSNKVSSYPTINIKTTSFLTEHKERVHLNWVKTKKFGATGLLDNGLRRFQPRLYPAFLYNIWGEVRSQVGMVGPRNLVLLWSAKFCSSYQASAFRLLKKVDFFRSFFMNECKVDNVDLLLFIMKPVELISKLFTVVVCSVMSVTKGTYFLLFSLCRWP